ncbi:unnamed protein product [Somion occarium]|uniref:Uncharacterized protein n=1 Tax=Somion occarium TaxID=3059160 RepID=A0ABP1CV49_9APHY
MDLSVQRFEASSSHMKTYCSAVFGVRGIYPEYVPNAYCLLRLVRECVPCRVRPAKTQRAVNVRFRSRTAYRPRRTSRGSSCTLTIWGYCCKRVNGGTVWWDPVIDSNIVEHNVTFLDVPSTPTRLCLWRRCHIYIRLRMRRVYLAQAITASTASTFLEPLAQ